MLQISQEVAGRVFPARAGLRRTSTARFDPFPSVPRACGAEARPDGFLFQTTTCSPRVLLVGRCARQPFDQTAGTKECSAGAKPKNGKQGRMRMQVPAGRRSRSRRAVESAGTASGKILRQLSPVADMPCYTLWAATQPDSCSAANSTLTRSLVDIRSLIATPVISER
jgi:hypothetical protein